MKVRTHVSRDSFLTHEQLEEGLAYCQECNRSPAVTPTANFVWTHYSKFNINRSYLCDPSIVLKTPSSHHSDRSHHHQSHQHRKSTAALLEEEDDSPFAAAGASHYNNNNHRGSSASVSSVMTMSNATSRRNEVTIPPHMQQSGKGKSVKLYSQKLPIHNSPHALEQQPKLDRIRAFLKPPGVMADLETVDEAALQPVSDVSFRYCMCDVFVCYSVVWNW